MLICILKLGLICLKLNFDDMQKLKPVDVVLSKDVLRGAGHQS